MAYSDAVDNSYLNPASQRSAALRRQQTIPSDGKPLSEDEVVQGRIFWLPPREELPDRAVKRAHGKGAVDEGIYNHPVVVLSSPVDDNDFVHFHLITSFQGRRLDEVYGKANEFHTSRRSWYLPVSPTPDHPDAGSKKAKKRFPTLELHGGAQLRWNSYVNLRHIYRVRWSHLRPYTNPEIIKPVVYRFERESMIRLLSKSRFLTGYEVGEQRHASVSKSKSKSSNRKLVLNEQTSRSLSPDSDTPSQGSETSERTSLLKANFLGVRRSPTRTAQQQPEESVGNEDDADLRETSVAPTPEIPFGANNGSRHMVLRIIDCILRWVRAARRRLHGLVRRRKYLDA